MKLLVIPCQTSLYDSPSKARSLTAVFNTIEIQALGQVLGDEGVSVDVVYNDVGYTPEILEKSYDAVLLKVPGFIFFGGVLDRRTSNLLEFVAERDLDIWIVYNDCTYKFSTGCSQLRKSLPKLKFANPSFTKEKALRGVESLERMYKKGIKIVCPGGDLEFSLKTDSKYVNWEMIPKPEVNSRIADLSFPHFAPMEQPLYDVCYAGVWRKERKNFLIEALDDERFKSVSTCSGLKSAGREFHLGLSLLNHEEVPGFKFQDQLAWYNQSLCQLVVSDPGTYGRFVSPRWFSALKTNSTPLIQSDFDPRRELLREGEDLDWLYVNNSEDVYRAVSRLKSENERNRVLKEVHNLKEPWFRSSFTK